MICIMASAPGRCGIVGNPSDMYGGCVVSCTVRERATCRLAPALPGIAVSNGGATAVLRTVADLDLRDDYLDIARSALAYFQVDPGASALRLDLETDIPMRAGMAGSTAMLAALVGALDAYLDLQLNRYALAETTRKIESQVLKIVCGLQDQHMAVFGGLNFMDFCGKEMLEQRDDEPLGVVEPLTGIAVPILLAHTGIEHHSGAVHATPRRRWLDGDPLVRQTYAAIADLGRMGKRAVVEQDWKTLGSLMNENQSLVSALGGSGAANDRLIIAARAAGAWGAKLAGAGGGGTIIAIGPDIDALAAALMDAGAERTLLPTPQPGLTVTAA